MIELGYMAKRIAERPDWIDAPHVDRIFAVSGCVSKNFCDYIPYWKHNGYWFFDVPEVIRDLASSNNIDLSGTSLLYYRGHDQQYDEDSKTWIGYEPEGSFGLQVSSPVESEILGYDVVTYSLQNSPECSPLSCNNVAAEVRVNKNCLIAGLDYAIELVSHGVFDNSEPGPYRIIEVHSVEWPGVG